MDTHGLMHSEKAAWAVGAAAVLVTLAAAFSYVGWLGIGLVGLLGLLISTRLSLHRGHAIADSDHGTGAVGLYAKQIRERNSHTSPEAKMAADEDRAKGARALYLMNTAFIVMMALGFGLFFLHRI